MRRGRLSAVNNHLKRCAHKSSATCAHESDLRQWREYLTGMLAGEGVRVSDITRQLVRGFIVQ